MTRTAQWLAIVFLAAAAAAGCGGSAGSAADTDVVLTGRAWVDGVALDAEWMGARVRHEGLVTPCQRTLPSVAGGEYEIAVYGAEQSAGCGRPGAEIVLWTHTGEQMLHATPAIPWPDTGRATFDVHFSTAAPLGATSVTTDFSGAVHFDDGARVPAGALIEAFVDDTLCGVATVRSGSFDGYIISAVGPDSRAGCRAGGAITFRVDGAAAVEAAVNSPEQSTHLDLTVAAE